MALADELLQRQAVATIAYGNFGDEAQMAADQLICCGDIVMVAPAIGQRLLRIGAKHRALMDLPDVAR
jgi:hypothetical protein